MMNALKVVLLICNIASSDCTPDTAINRYSIPTDRATPMGCFMVAYEELAKLSSYDSKTQKVVIVCGR